MEEHVPLKPVSDTEPEKRVMSIPDAENTEINEADTGEDLLSETVVGENNPKFPKNNRAFFWRKKKRDSKCCGLISGSGHEDDEVDGGAFERRSVTMPIDENYTGVEELAYKNNDFDVNMYATKKTAANGLLDLALLMANASQLKHIIMTEGEHRFYYPMLVLLGCSIVLQIIVGLGLLYLARVNISDAPNSDAALKRKTADKINNWLVAGIFLLTVVNVFISAFGLNEKGSMSRKTS